MGSLNGRGLADGLKRQGGGHTPLTQLIEQPLFVVAHDVSRTLGRSASPSAGGKSVAHCPGAITQSPGSALPSFSHASLNAATPIREPTR